MRFTRDVGNVVMDLSEIEALDVNALGGNDELTVNDLAGTGLTRVNVDLARAPRHDSRMARPTRSPGRGHGRGRHHRRDRRWRSGRPSPVSRPPCGITHADTDGDKLAIDSLAGNDDVSIDPAVNALIQVSE